MPLVPPPPTPQRPPSSKATPAIVAAIFAGVGVVVGLMFALPALVNSGTGNQAGQTQASFRHMYPNMVSVPARAGHLDVAVGDIWFKPSYATMPAGRVTLSAHNYGSTNHDVMIERTPIKFDGPGQPVDEAALAGVDGLAPGMTKSTTVVLGPGRYEIFCSDPGHYGAGQHKILMVTGHLPRGMMAT